MNAGMVEVARSLACATHSRGRTLLGPHETLEGLLNVLARKAKLHIVNPLDGLESCADVNSRSWYGFGRDYRLRQRHITKPTGRLPSRIFRCCSSCSSRDGSVRLRSCVWLRIRGPIFAKSRVKKKPNAMGQLFTAAPASQKPTVEARSCFYCPCV